MKRTRVAVIVGFGFAGAALTYLVELVLQASGRPSILPPYSLSITLIAVAVLVVLLAIPVRRRVTGKRKEPLSPFYSLRVAVLAKSSSHVGALLLGLGVGLTIFLVARPIAPGWDLLGRAIADLISAAILVAAGLIAERMCTLPPDDPEQESVGDPAPRA